MSAALINGPDFESLATELLTRGTQLRFQASGTSMAPFIRHGDWLVVVPVALAQVRRGMVLLCRLKDGRLVAHRVWGSRLVAGQVSFYLSGDANRYPDGWQPGSAVLGRIQTIERGARRWQTDAAGYRGLVWAWGLPGVRILYRQFQALRAWVTRRRRR